jgi:zinc/manganese transport system substrate-binding protein
MKSEGAKAILLEEWHERRTPELIAQKTGAKVVEVSVQVGADPNVKEYPGLCKSLVTKLVDALK